MDRCSFYNISFNVDKAVFDEIFITIYDILRFKFSDEEFFDVSKHYLCLLLADARDGFDVDLNWIIKYVFYFFFGFNDEKFTNKYKDDILIIQKKLLDKFMIKEKINDQVKRKIFTGYMVRF